jgi:hypothetical protein
LILSSKNGVKLMSTATVENIDLSKLTVEEKNAFAILANLRVEQVDQLKQFMKLGRPGVIGPGTLAAFLKLCKDQGFDLSEAGVNAFKEKHRLGNAAPYRGVIGAQTAGVYFREINLRTNPKEISPKEISPKEVSPKEISQSSSDASKTSQDFNRAIVAAAQSLMGMCTTDGPDGGRNACAWSLNRVLTQAGIPPLGDNPNYVPSLVNALCNGRGKEVSRTEAKAGDLVVANGDAHIGVGLDDGCRTVLSNSSSRGSFRWQSNTDFDGYYGGPSRIYRLIK